MLTGPACWTYYRLAVERGGWPNRMVCPPEDEPEAFRWPVGGLEAHVLVCGPEEQDRTLGLVRALLIAKASVVYLLLAGGDDFWVYRP